MPLSDAALPQDDSSDLENAAIGSSVPDADESVAMQDDSAPPQSQDNGPSISMDAKNAKPISKTVDGAIIFDNGMTLHPGGLVTQSAPKEFGDNAVFYASPGMKQAKLWKPPTQKPPVDLNEIAAKKAAEKGIFPNDFSTPDDYHNAVKNALGATDTTDTADAVMRGDVPADLKTVGFRQKAAVTAELARRGFNVKDAQLDYFALQKHISAANSTPIFKLRASAETASHSLDVIDDLADQWKAGNFPPLNKARMIAAKNGAFGPDAASLATQLDGQITDVTAALANVYMGGGTPTDQSLALAGKNLNSDWSEKVLKDMTNLSRKNIAIRMASINSIGPVAESQSNSNPSAAVPSVAAPAGAQPKAAPQINPGQPDATGRVAGQVYYDNDPRTGRSIGKQYLGNGQWGPPVGGQQAQPAGIAPNPFQ